MGMRNKFVLRIMNYELIFFIIFSFLFVIPDTVSSQVKIGVALPLFEDSDDKNKKQLGEDILNGITFALNEYNRNPLTKVILDVKDSKRDLTEVVRIFEEFAADSSISCVLGPIFSSELTEVVNFGKDDLLPIISPTATGDELAENHDYVFQLNPSYKVRGLTMARYLVKELGMKTFAVIAEESYGTNFSKHFEKEVIKLGGKIGGSFTYTKDSKNINEIVSGLDSVIRINDLFINLANLNITQTKKIETAGVRFSLIDSLIQQKIDVSIYYLLGKNARKIIDTLNIKPYQLKQGTTKYIQGYFDAIYVPVSNATEITMIVPELYSNNFSFFFAGTGDWNNEEVLKENKTYLKNAVFESEYFLDEGSQKIIELKTKLKATKFKLNKSFLFGYDSMSLLLNIISSGNKSRQDIFIALKKISGYEAIKSRISLDFSRINSELNILNYNGMINRIAKYKIQN